MIATTPTASRPAPLFAPAVPHRASRVLSVRAGMSLPKGADRRYVAYADAVEVWRAAFRHIIHTADRPGTPFRHARVIVAGQLRSAERATYEAAGAEVLDRGIAQLLPKPELEEALRSPHRDELVVGVTVDEATDVVVLHRGSSERLVVPASRVREWAAGREDVAGRVDLLAARPTDYGQTIQFGAFEVAVGAVLYEFDPEVRRRQRERLREAPSFGASVRRLRLQRGLRQEDVAGVSRRDVGRIERGETSVPRSETLVALASALGVTVDELGSY